MNEFIAMSNLKWESIETLTRFSFHSFKFLQPQEPEVEIKETSVNMVMPTLVERWRGGESGALRYSSRRSRHLYPAEKLLGPSRGPRHPYAHTNSSGDYLYQKC